MATKLTSTDEAAFQSWKQMLGLEDTNDYDLRAAWKGGVQPDERHHLPDTYKLPNHITFSDESIYSDKQHQGGKWTQDKNQQWHFIPGPENLKTHTVQEIKDYFKTQEPDAVLQLPQGNNPVNIPSWLSALTGAQAFANNPANGFKPTLGDAFQGIGHSMAQHARGLGGQPSASSVADPTTDLIISHALGLQAPDFLSQLMKPGAMQPAPVPMPLGRVPDIL